MTDKLLHTPLYQTHVDFGGRMVDFAGWSLPVSYAGITEEHVHTRTACSLFDVSHMGRLKMTGPDCERFLNRLCTRNLTDAEVGRSYYTHMCKEDGGVLDDMIVSRFEDDWGIVCNGANRSKIVAWIERHSQGYNVELGDETLDTAMIAVQGPKALELAAGLAGDDIASLKRYRFMMRSVIGAKIAIYRSGYTGEDGLEITAPAGLTRMLAPQLLGKPGKPHPVIKPAGLGARDTLRIEAAMPLYGHELSEQVDPLTGGQKWCVDLTKDFIGVERMRELDEKGLPRKLVGLQLEGRRIARQNCDVYVGDTSVGCVTSGTLSPTLGISIAMAYVPAEHSAVTTALEVDLGRSRVGAEVVKLPFYKRPK